MGQHLPHIGFKAVGSKINDLGSVLSTEQPPEYYRMQTQAAIDLVSAINRTFDLRLDYFPNVGLYDKYATYFDGRANDNPAEYNS